MNSIDSGGPPSFMQLNHPTAITALTISQQNVHCQSVLLFTGGQDNVIRVWTLADFCLLQNLTGHHRSILCLTLAPSIGQESTGKSQTTYPRLISSGADGTIRIWQDMISSGHSTSIDSDSDSKSNSNSSRNNNNDNPPPHYECVRIVSGCNGHVLSMLSSFGTMILVRIVLIVLRCLSEVKNREFVILLNNPKTTSWILGWTRWKNNVR